jgi:fatty-acid peroxygenase
MSPIPQDTRLDSTLSLLSEGYAFIPNRCRRLDTDVFETRLMLTKAVCMSGAEAASQFYKADRFTRRYAMPRMSLSLIQDFGSVMVMDGEDHRRRKAMFLSIMGPEAMPRILELTAAHWRARAKRWAGMDSVVLFHEAHVPLCGAICEWAGLTLDEEEVEKRAHEFEAMVEGTGSLGPRNVRGHLMRARTERWARDVIRRIRAGDLAVPDDSAAAVIAAHRDRSGSFLDVEVAAVELINVLRPTVANARYMVFIAMALQAHPEWRERLRAGDTDLEPFVHEVRRFYPFIPFIGGRVLQEFEWRGYRFAKDTWTLIDLYGTNRDPRSWDEPDAFRPERFKNRSIGPFEFIPSGGGDHPTTHRCPGEWITIEQMKTVARLLTREMRYTVPEQDLHIDLARMPALPGSRFVITDVRLAD